MYLVGFYSPKEKSGVTELSLSIYHWLKQNTTLKVAFISYGTLEKEEISNELHHGFADLTLLEQKSKVKQLKKEFDIIIYDASSQLSEGVLKLLPIVDRLFVVGEEYRDFAEKLHEIIQFNKIFDRSVKNFISHLQGNKTFIIRENKEQRVIGFTNSTKETDDLGQIIYTDYVTHYLERKFIEKNQQVFNKIKKIPREELYKGLHDLGVDFEKALLFHQYIELRVALGQEYEDVIEDMFPFLISYSFAELLDKFQNELFFVTNLRK